MLGNNDMFQLTFCDYSRAVVDVNKRTVKLFSLGDESPISLDHFYRDQVLPGLFDHDGILVAHAGSVVSSLGGLLVVGPSGCGKSTLVAALGVAGSKIQNDDAAIIENTDGNVSVRPIYPGMRLLPETLAAFFPLGVPTSPVSHYGTKRRVHRPDLLTENSAPLAAILFPTGEETDRVQLDPLSHARVCMDLIGQSMALNPTDLTRANSRLTQAAEVARRVPGFALSVPRDLAALPAACSDLLEELAALLGPRKDSNIP